MVQTRGKVISVFPRKLRGGHPNLPNYIYLCLCLILFCQSDRWCSKFQGHRIVIGQQIQNKMHVMLFLNILDMFMFLKKKKRRYFDYSRTQILVNENIKNIIVKINPL